MKVVAFILYLHLSWGDAARILAVFTAPSISHQVVFRPFTQELARRGHEVVIVTPDPAFPEGDTPKNLTEINVRDLLYSVWLDEIPSMKFGEHVTMSSHFDMMFDFINRIGKVFYKSDIVKQLQNQHFDLLVVEACHSFILALSHILKLPVVEISSFGSMFFYEVVGASYHPILYPEVHTKRMQNLTILEKVEETLTNLVIKNLLYSYANEFDQFMKEMDIPSINELYGKVTSLMLNVESIWEENRPVPIGVSYISGIHRWPEVPLSEELKDFMDSSKNGVIYVSFGSNVRPSLLPKDKVQVLLNALAKLPQDILLKWDEGELPWIPKNAKVSKWFPQIAVLGHPNVKLFITQCGLQSTEEAIDAGMPLLGIPFLFDQWTNAEKYVRHKIGLKLDFGTLTEEKIVGAVNTIIGDNSYRENVARFRTLMRDQPHSALHTAIWWTEYAIKYSGAPHLRSAAANMSWTQYYELELVLIVLAVTAIGFSAVYILFIFAWRCSLSMLRKKYQIKFLKKNL